MWTAAQRACDADEVLTVTVTGFNRGGLLIDWQGLHGFVPSSHLIGMPAVTGEDQRKMEFGRRVGQQVHGKIIELDRARGRFVLSERLAYNDRTRLEMLLTDMQPGQKRCGVVTTVCDFGVFVDLGGLEGLAHISEISWGRINHPSDMLRSGQNVDVYVMNVDRAQRRVALSVKRLQPDPWATVAERYQIDQIVHGSVTTVVDFGAFVRLEEGVEGLIHISELAEGNFLHPRNVVREGRPGACEGVEYRRATSPVGAVTTAGAGENVAGGSRSPILSFPCPVQNSMANSTQSSGAKTRARASEKRRQLRFTFGARGREIAGVLLIALAILSCLALSGITRGSLADGWSTWLYNLFGWGAFGAVALIGGLGALLIWLAQDMGRVTPWRTIICLEVAFFGLLGALHAYSAGADIWQTLKNGEGGGVVGWGLLTFVSPWLGRAWAGVIFVALMVIGLTVAFSIPWAVWFRSSMERICAWAHGGPRVIAISIERGGSIGG